MAAPMGNRNGASGQKVKEAMRKALTRYEGDGVKQGQALFKICTKQIEKALKGDSWAANFIADRTDGKAVQAISGPTGEQLTVIERVVVRQVVDNSDVIEGEIDNDRQRAVIGRDNQQGDAKTLLRKESEPAISDDS